VGDATEFVGDLSARLRNRVQISTDCLKAYNDAIDRAFGTDVDYGSIIKTYINRLRTAIRDLHECESVHVSTTPVTERFDGKTVWEGEVETFTIQGHPKASTCYAWAYKGDDGREHYTAVLKLPPVDSPQTAVKVAIRMQVKNETKET
jgi:hypothetical protein